MNWKIVFEKFVTTALTGALASIVTVFSAVGGVTGVDARATGLISIFIGLGGALVNWWKHKDVVDTGS